MRQYGLFVSTKVTVKAKKTPLIINRCIQRHRHSQEHVYITRLYIDLKTVTIHSGILGAGHTHLENGETVLIQAREDICPVQHTSLTPYVTLSATHHTYLQSCAK